MAHSFSSSCRRFTRSVLSPPCSRRQRVMGELRHADRADRLRHRTSLRDQHVNLPQLRDNLLGLALPLRHPSSAIRSKAIPQGGPLLRGQTSVLGARHEGKRNEDGARSPRNAVPGRIVRHRFVPRRSINYSGPRLLWGPLQPSRLYWHSFATEAVNGWPQSGCGQPRPVRQQRPR
jgi:hypothetical protein